MVLFTSVDEVIEIPCQRHLKHPRVSLFSVEAKGSFLDGKLAPSRVYCLYEKPPFAALIGLIKEVGSDWRLHPLIYTILFFVPTQDVEKKRAEPKTPRFISLNQDIVVWSQEEMCGLKYVM